MAKQLQIGVLGLRHAGDWAVEVIRRAPEAELVAVADRDATLATRQGRVLGVPAFDDFRTFLHAQPLDAVVVTSPSHASHEMLRLAASRQTPVWRTPPLARNFSEAVELVRWYGETDTPLAVGRFWPRTDGWLSAEHLRDSLGSVFLTHAHGTVQIEEELEWQGDRERAGGGVLLHQGYEAIDLGVFFMGLPDMVMGATSRHPGEPADRLRHDTEDTACVLTQHAGGVTASLTFCRKATPPEWGMAVYAKRGTLTIKENRFTHVSSDGRELHSAAMDKTERFDPSLTAFLDALSAGESIMTSRGQEHLKTMAVIEAAYLSARTGQPESPVRLFEMQGQDPTAIA